MINLTSLFEATGTNFEQSFQPISGTLKWEVLGWNENWAKNLSTFIWLMNIINSIMPTLHMDRPFSPLYLVHAVIVDNLFWSSRRPMQLKSLPHLNLHRLLTHLRTRICAYCKNEIGLPHGMISQILSNIIRQTYSSFYCHVTLFDLKSIISVRDMSIHICTHAILLSWNVSNNVIASDTPTPWWP